MKKGRTFFAPGSYFEAGSWWDAAEGGASWTGRYVRRVGFLFFPTAEKLVAG